jgi:hypothetical protein
MAPAGYWSLFFLSISHEINESDLLRRGCRQSTTITAAPRKEDVRARPWLDS